MPSRMRRLPAPDQCLIGGPLRATPRMRARTRIVGSSCTTLPTPEEGAAIESSRGRRRKPEHCRTCDSFTGRRQRGSALTASGHKACFAAAGQRKSVAGAPSDIRLRLKLNGSFRPKLSLDVAYPSDSNQSEGVLRCPPTRSGSATARECRSATDVHSRCRSQASDRRLWPGEAQIAGFSFGQFPSGGRRVFAAASAASLASHEKASP